MSDPDQPERHPKDKRLVPLAVAALGVVFGDIGTSPLYALKECFTGSHGVAPTRENVLGVLSLVFWSLNFLITFKYLIHMMRADNRGEGGILALLALLRPNDIRSRGRWALILAGVFGAAMLYGDGIITPAISVLGAVEGLSIATPALQQWVVPIGVVIISALFAVMVVVVASAAAGREVHDELHQCPPFFRRHARGGFVHEEQARPVGERYRELNTLEVAIREHRARALALVAHANSLEQRVGQDLLPALRPRREELRHQRVGVAVHHVRPSGLVLILRPEKVLGLLADRVELLLDVEVEF